VVRVLILYCEEGEGHASAARALAAELERAGAEAVALDAMQGGLGRLIPWLSRDAYRLQVRWLRWTYGLEFFLFTRVPLMRALARFGLARLGAKPLLRLIERHRPALVVSTHPTVTNVLGFLGRRGRIDLPTVATITDFGVHALWAHPGVDLHLVMDERSVPAVERVAGSGSTRVVGALVREGFRTPVAGRVARRALGLPAAAAIAVVSGGGWGVGEVATAAEAALAVPGLTVVCLSGKNEILLRRLERRFGGRERVLILPFTERMPELLAAADVLVDSTLGVTCLEALTVGCPVVAFGAPPGHSRENGRALTALGLAQRAGSKDELTDLLAELVAKPRARAVTLERAESAAVATLTARIRARPERRRRKALIVFASVGVTLLSAGWSLASPTPYPVLARTFDLNGVSSVQTRSAAVGVLVEAPSRCIPPLGRMLARENMHATFVVAELPSTRVRAVVASLRDGLLPAPLTAGPLGAGAVRYSTRLRGLAKRLGLRGGFYYVRPRSGFTLGDYLAARMAGGRLVAPLTMTGPTDMQLRSLAPGRIVLVDASAPHARDSLMALARVLSARELRGVSLEGLLTSAANVRATAGERASTTPPPLTSRRANPRPLARQTDPGQRSPVRNGASATGRNVVSANTSGATCTTGRRCRADISLSVPRAEAAFIATNQKQSPSQR
jgi:UDP-N-acetylglucosamine:LPS N-acetylglucosamine transferase